MMELFMLYVFEYAYDKKQAIFLDIEVLLWNCLC